MSLTLYNLLNQTNKDTWIGYDNRPIYQWASDNIIIPTAGFSKSGPFSVENSKWMIPIFDDLKNPDINEVNLCASIQSGKSVIAQIFTAWSVLFNDGLLTYLCQSDEMVGKMMGTRLNPILDNTKCIQDIMPVSRKLRKNKEINFGHIKIESYSAKPNNLASQTIKTMIEDECWLYEDGFIGLAKGRQAAYEKTYKVFRLSQANTEGSEWHREFNMPYRIRTLGWMCPKCNCKQPYIFDQFNTFTAQRPDGTWYGLIFDKIKDKDGRYKINDTADTVRLECMQCKEQFKDTPANRRMLNDNYCYIDTINEDGNKNAVSYHVPNVGIMGKSFRKIIIEFLQAREVKKYLGDAKPLRDYYMEKLARFWREDIDESIRQLAVSQFDVDTDWQDEVLRVMAIDCQNLQELGNDPTVKLYSVVCALGKNNEIRLLHRGWSSTFEEIEAIQKKYKVRCMRTYIDAGDSMTKVCNEAVKHLEQVKINGKSEWSSWIALKGSPAEKFKHPSGISKYYKIEPPVTAAQLSGFKGKIPCKWFLWSNPSIKDILHSIIQGRSQYKLILPNSDPEFDAMMQAEKRTTKKSGSKVIVSWQRIGNRPNEAWDCMNMCLVAFHLADRL